MNLRYLLLIVPALLTWFAQARVRKVYEEHGERENGRGATGLEVARDLLSRHGLDGVTVERAAGHLTDHYDPQAKTLRLTDGVANGRSVTALSIVGHEVGHAVQDAEGYRFMRLRTRMSKVVSQVAQWSSLAFVGGMLFGIPLLMGLSGLIMAGLVVFTLVTLPVERDASNRALKMLEGAGLASPEEGRAVQRVLRAAAFTYLTALGQRLATFFFFVAVVGAARGA
ncbi:MAG: zinc metallopeptidase [Anaerolineae bacterium]|jgi:Zn-dependent membrane protease YugP